MELSAAGTDALGYVGGCILAASLVPQIARLVVTRSATDISILWSLLYLTGNILSLTYLLLIGALAGAIPVIFETVGGIITIALKLLFDYTDYGKQHQYKRAAQLEQQLIAAIEQKLDVKLQTDTEHEGNHQISWEDSARMQASFAGKQPSQQQLNPAPISTSQLQLQTDLADGACIDPDYQEPLGLSSDDGATVVRQGVTAAEAAPEAARAELPQIPAKLSATQPASADSHMHMLHNPLAIAAAPTHATEPGYITGSKADTVTPGSTNGACPAISTTHCLTAARTRDLSLRYSCNKHKASSCYAPSSTAGGTINPSTITAVGTTSAAVQAPAFLPLALQLQQQQLLPWYLKGGISHAAALPYSSSTGSTFGSGSTAAAAGRQCCCHVCGAVQLSREVGTSRSGAVKFRASFLGQPRSQRGEQITTPARKRHRTVPGQQTTQQEEQYAPEYSSKSVTAFGTAAWQAVCHKSIQLLSLTGMNNTNSAGALDGNTSGSRGSNLNWKASVITHDHATAAVAAVGLATCVGAVGDAQVNGTVGAAAPAADCSRAPPKLSVIHSLPSTPRASEMLVPGQSVRPSNTDPLKQQHPKQGL